MDAIELAPEFSSRADDLHPKRYKQVVPHIFALQQNPRAPMAIIVDAETYYLYVGLYAITYKIDDAQRRVRVLWLEMIEEV